MNKLFSTIMSVCLACNVQATDLFKTSQDIALRAPSVPLITSDTYLAIWSPYNELNEGNTEHWTAATHPLLGALRVDGKVYRFMGKEQTLLQHTVTTQPAEHTLISACSVRTNSSATSRKLLSRSLSMYYRHRPTIHSPAVR